jgi:flagellar basal body rod protein FlgB
MADLKRSNLNNKSNTNPIRIELVSHTENRMKYQSLHTILKYHFGMKYQYFVRENLSSVC